MTQQNLQKIFESEFNWNSWKEVMNFTFPEFKFSLVQTDITRDTKAHKKNAGHIKEHGNTTLSSAETLTLCEVLVKDSVRLDRNIKSVRSLVADLAIPNYQAIVAVFHNADNTKWRFTLVVKEFTESHKTIDKKPDSYTYVFGVGEKGRTASERFFKLANTPNKTLKDLEEAFSVEALSKKFFREYKDIYKKFVDDIITNQSRLALFKENTREKQEKSARDFVKKMMGRIVFLYFLQKKGWLGCKTKWENGDEQFMNNFVKKAKQDDLFYHDYLEPLFFDTLNDRRVKHDEDCIIQKTNFGKIPYLNGGLFEKDENHPNGLTISWGIFKELFETLDGYNFTIIEDDPEFKEVAVDPEMLGHVFEDLLEERKEKGTFYTPKVIVHYMCQESLYEYLKTYLKQENHWPVSLEEEQQLDESLQRFVKRKLYKGIANYNKILAKALKEVKICDPAIGSGAFPMGLLNEIYHCIHKLHDENPDAVGDIWGIGAEWKGNKVKLNIIQNSIYGVDIERGAVDIARLRFWLSLIIDEPTPTPLPNLEYKIVVGNSLVSKLGDDFVDIDWNANDTSHGLFGLELAENKRRLLQKISAAQKESFSPESNKKKLAKEIRNLKIDLLINQLELMVATKGIQKKPTGSGRSVTKQTELYLQTVSWKESIKQLNKLKLNPSLPLNFFDWRLDFPEVLNPLFKENGGLNSIGFDIVIGNPPYISYYSNTGSDLTSLERKHFAREFVSVSKESDRINSMNLFSERGLMLLKANGVLSFIVNKTMAVLPSYSFYRKYIVNNSVFKYVITDLIPFEAIVDCLIFCVVNQKPGRDYKFKYYRGNVKEFSWEDIQAFRKNGKNELHIPKETSILDKIDKAPARLKDILTINRGVNIGGCFDVFLSKAKLNEDYFKYLSGTKCIKPYSWEWTAEDGYMIFDQKKEDHLRKKRGKTLALGNHDRYTQPRLFIPESAPRIMAGYAGEIIYSAYGLLVGTSANGMDYLKYACGLLNSKVITFYSIQREILRKGNKATPHVGVKGLKELPVYVNLEAITSISQIVDEILSAKKENTNADIAEQQIKIDKIIYNLYGLSDEDITVVETTSYHMPNF